MGIAYNHKQSLGTSDSYVETLRVAQEPNAMLGVKIHQMFIWPHLEFVQKLVRKQNQTIEL